MITPGDVRVEQVKRSAKLARAAADADSERWEHAGVAQDTEEAEESGRLIGYADGLELAIKILEG